MDVVIFGGVAAVVLVIASAWLVLRGALHRVGSAEALVIYGTRDPRVAFRNTLVIPLLQRAERISLQVRPLVIRRTNENSLRCKDNVNVNIEATFVIGISRHEDDILRVANHVGCQRAMDEETLDSLFTAKLSDTLRTVVGGLTCDEVMSDGEALRDRVLAESRGGDLGYRFESVSIGQLSRVPEPSRFTANSPEW